MPPIFLPPKYQGWQTGTKLQASIQSHVEPHFGIKSIPNSHEQKLASAGSSQCIFGVVNYPSAQDFQTQLSKYKSSRTEYLILHSLFALLLPF